MGLWRRNAGLPLSVAYRFGIGLGPSNKPGNYSHSHHKCFPVLIVVAEQEQLVRVFASFKLPALLVFNIRLLQNLIQAYIGLLLVVIRPVHSADTASS